MHKYDSPYPAPKEIGKAPNLMNPDDPAFKDKQGDLKSDVKFIEDKFWVPFQFSEAQKRTSRKTEPNIQREYHVRPTSLEYKIVDIKRPYHYIKKPGSLFWEFVRYVYSCIIQS